MPPRVFQVDAFADRPFTGNPAAVVLLDGPAPDEWMQRLAAELDLPATAFVTAPGDGGARGLRWFTAGHELALCGHGTLATTHVLVTEGLAGADPIRYDTGAGRLTARSTAGTIELDFPAHPAVPAPEMAGPVAHALWRTERPAPFVEAFRGGDDLLAVVRDSEDVHAVVVDADALVALGARCVIVSAPLHQGDDDHLPPPPDEADADVVCRVFCPSVGVLEDPVTGSAHCLLGPYWAERLGRDVIRSHQVSRRGGRVEVEPRGDRVALRGRAVTVLRSELATGVQP